MTRIPAVRGLLAVWLLAVGLAGCGDPASLRVLRFEENPIIRPEMLAGDAGENINGPSLIRAPGWLENPLGKYYLYFAHHQGGYIRLAYADRLDGPWKIYQAGTLRLDQAGSCVHHVASPDVHVDDSSGEIRMYFHCPVEETLEQQHTFVATSRDGIHFAPRPEVLGLSYFRVFEWDEFHYAVGMPGVFYRSRSGLDSFEEGPTLFNEDMRHSALKLDGNVLSVFHTVVGEEPERIVLSKIRLTSDWMSWKESEPVVILEPERDYEGADLRLEPSARDLAPGRVRQLRDPAIFEEDGKTYLLYSVAGESGIAIAEIVG